MGDLPQMRWRDGYFAAHEENRRRLPGDTQPEVVRADYTLVVNSKPELLACAALWDPFGSSASSSGAFAWVDAGAGRKDAFPLGPQPVRLPPCPAWSLCVGRRMWIFFDFRSRLKRLQHGSTFDSTVLLGGREGVLLYALWFQWAIARYLAEGVMDDEQGVIAEVWWSGEFAIRSYYGMRWEESLSQMLRAGEPGDAEGAAASVEEAQKMGRWFGGYPNLVWRNNGTIWVPFAGNLSVVKTVVVNKLSDEDMERIAYGLWCLSKRFGYYERFCEVYSSKQEQVEYPGFDTLPWIVRGNQLVVEV